MITAPKPQDEAQRLAALDLYNILDTAAEPGFDALTRLASNLCGTPISLVSLIDADRQWFKSSQGLPGVHETPRDLAFCAHAILGQELLEVADATADARFHDNPLVTDDPKIRFYAGVPLLDPQGYALGTLCVIDRQPRQLTDAQRQALKDIAAAVVGLIQARAGESRFRRIVDAAPFGVALIDRQGRLQQPNQALLHLLDCAAGDLVDQPLTTAISIADEPGALSQLYDRARARNAVRQPLGAAQTLLVTRRHDGSQIPVELGLTNLGGGLTALTMADTSVRDAISQAAQRARAELQRVIDGLPAMVAYWDRDLHNLFSNKAYQYWLGFSPEQIKGSYIRDIIGEERFAQNLPYIEGVLAGTPQMFERPIVNQAGEERLTLASYVPDWQDGIVQGFYVFVSDITAFKAAETARQKAEAELKGVIEAATGFALISTGLDGTIRLFSRGAELLLGYSAAELINQHTPAVFHLESEVRARGEALTRARGRPIEGFEVFVSGAREGETESADWTYVRKDGSTVPVHLVVSGVRGPAGELIGFLGIARDITDQRAYEQGLAAAKEAAEAGSRAKSDFVANMSHEIRTPMNAVLGITHLLGETALTNAQRKYVDLIRASGQSLLALLNDVLDFSRIEAGKIALESKRFRLEDTLKMIASIMTVNAGDKDLELAIGVAADVPGYLLGDSLRLQQVLTNLVSNAIKFTARGEVAVSVTREPAPAGGEALRFEVRDTGIGIQPEHHDKLFSAFTQADTSTTRRYGGSGLGLTICKQLVELMGGQIGLASEPGVGSRFWFTLPLREPAAAGDVRRPVLGRLRVLVADDNPTSLGILRDLVASWGWQAYCVDSGEQALRRYNEQLALGTPYDLVVADWYMPGTDGLATLQGIKAATGAAPPVIVMINARARKQFAQAANARLADAVLTKPVTSSSLFDAIHEAFARRDPGYEPEVARTPTTTGQLRLDGIRLLLVEDNELNQFVARSILQNAGATVIVAANGEVAIHTLRSSPQAIDLVLMDMQMPVMDGLQATRIIRNELGLSLPVLAMSAGVMAAEREQCLAAGMNDFIAKPIDVTQMLGTIRKTVHDHARAQAARAMPAAAEQAVDIDGFLSSYAKDSAYLATFRRLITELGEKWPGMMTAAQEAWQAGRPDEAAAIIHKARGSAATLGARPFAELALALEKAIGRQARDEVEAGFPPLQAAMDGVVAAIRQWLASTPPPTTPAYSTRLDKALLAQLRNALQENSMAAIGLYEALKPALAERLPANELTQLEQGMQTLEFARALGVLGAVG